MCEKAAQRLLGVSVSNWEAEIIKILHEWREEICPEVPLSKQYNCLKYYSDYETQDFQVKDWAEKFISGIRAATFLSMAPGNQRVCTLDRDSRILEKACTNWWKSIRE